MGIIEKTNRRVYTIDFKEVEKQYVKQNLEYAFPLNETVQSKGKVPTVSELRKQVNAYFDDCMRPARDKYGNIITKDDGKPWMVQTIPYTMTGLANAIGMNVNVLHEAEFRGLAGLIPKSHTNVLIEARQRVQAYAEERLFDKEGSAGAQFVMENLYGVNSEKERSEIDRNRAAIEKVYAEIKLKQVEAKLKREEFKFKQRQALKAEKERAKEKEAGNVQTLFTIKSATREDVEEANRQQQDMD